MSKMKEKNLRRFIALYIVGSVAFGGVAYAAEEESTRFLDGAATVIDEDVYSVAGGSFNASVDTTSMTINSNGQVGTVQGGGIVKNGAQADVSQVTIKVNGGTVVDLIAGGKVENGGTANITRKSSIEITGGTVENVTGGGSANSGHAAVKESEITINEGSRIGFFQGGGNAKGDNATTNVDKVTITINGGTFGGAIGDNDYSDESFGGGFANVAVTQGKTNTSNVGDITINIHNGTFKNNVYGGGMATVEDGDAEMPGLGAASAHVNNVKIAIDGNAKTEGDVTIYAGGATWGDRTNSSVDNAEITISGNVNLLEVNGGADADGGSGTASVGTSKITVSGDVNITNGIVGGGYSSRGGSAIVKNSIIEINGGTVGMVGGGGAAYGTGTTSTETSTININNTSKIETIIGGGSAENGTTHVGTSNITVNNGSIGYIQGGGDANYNGAKSTVDTVNITVKNGNIGLGSTPGDDMTISGIVGGGMAWVGEAENKPNESNVKTVKLNIAGGTIHNATGENVVSGVFGGGIAGYTHGTGAPTTADAKVHVDSVNMEISGGTIETDVYAGGATFADANKDGDKITSTVDNATINISNGDIKGNVYAGGKGTATVENSTINISGGKIGGNISAEQNITGKSALNFTAGTGSNIDGAVSGFDTVTVKTGAKTTFSGANVVDGTAAIQAKALNIEENSTVTVAKNMTFNLGSASSPIPAAFSLRSARVANGMLNLSGELKIVTGAELTLENTTLVSHNTGMVTVGAKKDGSTLSVGKLNMAANSDFADNHMNLNIGLPIDVIKNLSAAEINDIIEQSLAPTIANGLDLNSLDISNGTNAEYQYIKDASGKIVDVKLNDTYLGFYTGVRQANAYIAKNMIGNIHDRNTALRSGEKANDFWVNIRGGKTDIDNQYGKAEVKNQYYQLGYDWDVSSGDDKAVVGVYFSKIYGDVTQYNIKSDIDNAYDFGIYGMKEFSNGTYLGLVSRYGQTKNTAKIDDRKVDWKDKGYALSAEFGKRMAQPNGWLLEPYMQLTYNHLSDSDLNTGNTDVTLEGSNLLDGKVGVRFIEQEQENQNNNIYAGISYARGLSGDFKMNSRSGMNMTKMDNDTNSFKLALGMNRQISKCSTVNLNTKKEFGDYDGWSVQGMVNVNF